MPGRQAPCRHVPLPQREDEHTLSLPHVLKQTYSITRYRVTRYIHHVTDTPLLREGEEFVPLDKIHGLPMASPDRKALNSPPSANCWTISDE